MLRSVGLAVALTALALLSAAAPLLVYSTSLALFGLAHVAVEMRYVEARFVPRLSTKLLRGLAVLLALVVTIRILKIAGVPGDLTRAELTVVALIAASVLVDIGLDAGVAAGVTIAVAIVVAVGLAVAPMTTILLLSAIHNWTPVGLVLDGAPRQDHRRYGAWGLLAFGLLPMLLALGAFDGPLAPWLAPNLSMLPTGALASQLGTFLPDSWIAAPWAAHVFSALAFAQCMHYTAVLGVLPKIAPPAAGPLSRASWSRYLAVIVLGTALLFAGYTSDFAGTRRVYGIFSAVHAWVELPILLLALAPKKAASLAFG